MIEFKHGDKVRVIEPHGDLLMGSEHIVEKVSDIRTLWLYGKAEGFWNFSRFELVREGDEELVALRAFKAEALASGYREPVKIDPDLDEARAIALANSRQTGKNADRFLSGEHDKGYGVKTALAAIKRGRELAALNSNPY